MMFSENDYSIVDIKKDGETHIRISKDAATEMGRKLDPGMRRPFVHPTDGPFESFIGWWLWKCNGGSDVFRKLHQDNLMMTAMHDNNPSSKDWDDAVDAIKASILTDKELASDLRNNKLPFYLYSVHSYVDKEGSHSTIVPVTWYTPYISALEKAISKL